MTIPCALRDEYQLEADKKTKDELFAPAASAKRFFPRFRSRILMFALIAVGVAVVPAFTGPTKDFKSNPAFRPIEVDLSEAVGELIEHLDRSVAAKFEKKTLVECLSELGKQTDTRFVLDAEALENHHLSPDTKMTLEFKKVTLEEAVHVILDEHDLSLTYGHDALIVTDHATADGRLFTRIYPTADISVLPAEGRDLFVGRDLVRLIQQAVDPESWSDEDGPANITYEPMSFSLVITQTLIGQRKVEALLRSLRQAKQRTVHFVESRKNANVDDTWRGFLTREEQLRGLFEEMVQLEQVGNASIVGIPPGISREKRLSSAAHLLAAKALAFASEVKEEVESPDLSGPGGKVLVRQLLRNRKHSSARQANLVTTPVRIAPPMSRGRP